jgi:signal transduction histidine kinase
VREVKMMKHISYFSNYFSLRLALVIYVIVPLALAVAISGYLALNAVEQNMEKRMQKDLELVARAIQLPLSHALELDRVGTISSALESAFSIGRVYSAYVYDQSGRQIASAGRTEPEVEQERLTELAEDGKEMGEYGRVAGREVYSYFVPLTDSGGRINGLLQLTRRESDIQNQISSMKIQGAAWLGLSLMVMTLLVLFGHHRALGKYFSSLITSMSRVAHGDTDHRFIPHGPREIVLIGRRFNHMLDSMENARKELKKRRNKQEILKSQLRQSEKLAAIGQLSAGIAHELGTPLSVISGKAQRSLRDPGLNPDLSNALKEIRREVDRMEYIIRQLLDFSRDSETRIKPAQPARLAYSSASAAAEEADKMGVELKLRGDEYCDLINVDPTRIEQALVNLLRNAIQSASPGKVILSWWIEHNQACFQVDDNGPGISKDIEPRVFEPFFTTKQVGAGTGLGLAVVHGIVREHNGQIEFGKSDLGGAFFRIRLPVDLNQ